MSKRTVIISSILLVLIFSTFLLTACGTSSGGSASTTDTSSSGGQALLQDRCTACHSTRRITSAHFSADQWTQVVDSMIDRGARLSDQERQTLIDYLAQTYP